MKLFEIKQTKTKTGIDQPNLDTFRQAFQDQMSGNKNVPQKREKRSAPQMKKSSSTKTRAKTSQIDMPPEGDEKMSFLQSLDIEDQLSDEQAAQQAGYQQRNVNVGEREPKKPGTDIATIEMLPDTVSQQISQYSATEPEWHQVKNLPGYLKSPIRAMGRQIFGQFTNTPIEDIQVLANIQNQGPNSKQEINAVARWLHNEGERDTDGEYDFNKSIPDYSADFKMYNANGYTFMVVKDFAGNYVYAWPLADQKGFEGSERTTLPVQ